MYVIPPRLRLQDSALGWCSEHDKGWIAAEQGLGKTRVVVDEQVDGPTEIVAPAHMCEHWLRQIAYWGGHMAEAKSPSTPIDAVRDQLAARRIAQHVRGHRGYEPEHQFYVLSYEGATKLIPPRGIRRFVFDESHYLGTKKAKRTVQCQRRAADKTALVRMLSGTPIPSRPVGLWPMASAIGMTALNYSEWGYYFCDGKVIVRDTKYGVRHHYDFRGASNVPQLRELFGKWAFRVTQKEAVDLPPKMRRLIVLGAKPDTRDRRFDVGEIRKNPNPLAFEGLAEVLHEHGQRKAPQAIEYIESVMQDETPVLIGVRHKKVGAAIVEALEKADYRVARISGDTPIHERDKTVQAFRRGQLDAIVGSTRAMSTGIDGLQDVCRYGIQVEADWSFATNVQFEDRLNRIGQTRRVQWDYLVCDGSIDARIVEAIMWKEEVADQVYGDSLRALAEEFM